MWFMVWCDLEGCWFGFLFRLCVLVYDLVWFVDEEVLMLLEVLIEFWWFN